MEYAKFKELLATVPERDRAHFAKLGQFACIGGSVWPQYQSHLD